MDPAAFLDRDGTIIEDVGYLDDPARIELIDGAADGMRMLSDAGYRLVVVTNQSGIARGFYTESRLAEIHAELVARLSGLGIELDGVYHCPHHPEGAVAEMSIACGCRKPAPGMLLRACRELGLDARGSVMIGDAPRDVEAGFRGGCDRAYLLGASAEGYPAEWTAPTGVVATLEEAARSIIGQTTA